MLNFLKPSKPSPEREGNYGTKEWWNATAITAAKFVGGLALASLAVLLPTGANAENKPNPIMNQEKAACISYDQFLQRQSMHGIGSVSIDLVCGYSRPQNSETPVPVAPELPDASK